MRRWKTIRGHDAGESGEVRAADTGFTVGRALAGDPDARTELAVLATRELEKKDPRSRHPLWEILLLEEPWDWPKHWPKQ